MAAEPSEPASVCSSPVHVLNSAFRVVSYTGGSENDKTGIDNVLIPKLRPFHCSGPGLGHSLELAVEDGAQGVYLTHLVVHGAPGCTECVKNGKITFTAAASFDDSASAPICFETDKLKAEWSTALGSPQLAKRVRISFDGSHGEGANVDVGMLVLVGVLADQPLPTSDVCTGAIPFELGVTDLKKVKKRKRWLPLESNPRVVGKYLQKLGFNSGVAPHELLSLEDWALEMIPRPARAILLLFPIGKETEEARKNEAAVAPAEDNIIHMKQLIGNACGTIALVHVMANLCRHGGEKADAGSWLEKFIAAYKVGMTSDDVGTMLEEDVAIEAAHAEAEAESEAKNITANANLHFVAFVDINGVVVELDGRRDAPVVRGLVSDCGGDFLVAAVSAIRQNYMNISPDALRFNMMALCGGSAPVLATTGYAAGAVPAMFAPNEEHVAQLMSFGFDADAARSMLEATGGNVEAAANLLLGAG